MSDLHLGSKVCRRDKILEVLKKNEFHTLIVNGDLFDSNDPEKLTQKDLEIIETLRKVANKHPTFLIGGNHGRKLDLLAEDAGIIIRSEYAFTLGNKQFLCLHGDEFDMFVKYFPLTSHAFTYLYYLIQKVSGRKQKTSVLAKLVMKKVLGVPRRQERLALKRGASERASVVICSHTHIPQLKMKGGILFINTGSFCDIPSTYVTIGKDGKTDLREI